MATNVLTIYDATVGAGPAEPALTLELLTSEITARELLRRRVDEEARLRAAEGRSPVDVELQVEQATLAFQAQQLLLLVDDTQVETLDDELRIGVDTKVTFLRLMPLVGG